MKAVAVSSLEWAEVSGHRAGGILFKRLLQGHPGAPDNFEFSLTKTEGDYFTPRHRHNFDQVRYCLSGSMNYAPNKDMNAGSLGYFPEGAFYGPQAGSQGSTVVLLQLGGASGNGFMSYEQLNRGFEKLRATGSFEKGTFSYRDGGGGLHKKDGYEAVWEHVNGRQVEYSKPRYEEPILMNPDNFAWIRDGNGIETKIMGEFGERGLRIGFVKLRQGFGYDVSTRESAELQFILKGAVEVDRRDYGPETALEFSTADTGKRIVAQEETVALFIDQPRFESHSAAAAQASRSS